MKIRHVALLKILVLQPPILLLLRTHHTRDNWGGGREGLRFLEMRLLLGGPHETIPEIIKFDLAKLLSEEVCDVLISVHPGDG